MVNMREIGKASGVSIATVSRVINGSPLVKQDTRNKVLKVISSTTEHTASRGEQENGGRG